MQNCIVTHFRWSYNRVCLVFGRLIWLSIYMLTLMVKLARVLSLSESGGLLEGAPARALSL